MLGFLRRESREFSHSICATTFNLAGMQPDHHNPGSPLPTSVYAADVGGGGDPCRNIWLWLKKPVPKWNPGKWEIWTKTCGLPLLFNFEPHSYQSCFRIALSDLGRFAQLKLRCPQTQGLVSPPPPRPEQDSTPQRPLPSSRQKKPRSSRSFSTSLRIS